MKEGGREGERKEMIRKKGKTREEADTQETSPYFGADLEEPALSPTPSWPNELLPQP